MACVVFIRVYHVWSLKCCVCHRASLSFIDVPYMMCLTNDPSFLYAVTSMASAIAIWKGPEIRMFQNALRTVDPTISSAGVWKAEDASGRVLLTHQVACA